MMDPRAVVPESIMPSYGFMMNRELTRDDAEHIRDLMSVYRVLGHPYTDEMMDLAVSDFFAQVDEFGDDVTERYPGAQQRNFDGQPQLTEMDAIIAYMQMLGTLVDFDTFVPDASR